MHLLLASASPRRRQLLEEYGYTFRVESAGVEEIAPPHLTVGEVTLYNAKQKALAVARNHPEALVLGVDTLVALEGEGLGKPRDLEDAAAMLGRLGGRTHQVYSGVWLVHGAARRAWAALEASHVRFHPLDAAAIARYLARVQVLDKAGSYAAQDEGPGSVVAEIAGSRTNVIGLPMERLATLLSEAGYQSEPLFLSGSP